MRLIDADNLKMPNDAPYKASVKRVVALQPTVEAKEVVHGEWVRTKFASEYICSNCQALTYAELTRTGYKNFNFCPNCGADMRG